MYTTKKGKVSKPRIVIQRGTVVCVGGRRMKVEAGEGEGRNTVSGVCNHCGQKGKALVSKPRIGSTCIQQKERQSIQAQDCYTEEVLCVLEGGA